MNRFWCIVYRGGWIGSGVLFTEKEDACSVDELTVWLGEIDPTESGRPNKWFMHRYHRADRLTEWWVRRLVYWGRRRSFLCKASGRCRSIQGMLCLSARSSIGQPTAAAWGPSVACAEWAPAIKQQQIISLIITIIGGGRVGRGGVESGEDERNEDGRAGEGRVGMRRGRREGRGRKVEGREGKESGGKKEEEGGEGSSDSKGIWVHWYSKPPLTTEENSLKY